MNDLNYFGIKNKCIYCGCDTSLCFVIKGYYYFICKSLKCFKNFYEEYLNDYLIEIKSPLANNLLKSEIKYLK